MKMSKKFLSMLLILSIVPSLITFPTFAASSPYETVKDNVPIWSQPSKSSTKVRTVSTQGTILYVVSSTTNSHGNLWYKLDDNNWVYSGNVRAVVTCQHDYSGGICSTCKHEWPYRVETITQTLFTVSNADGAKIWNRPYSKNSTHMRTEQKGSNLIAVAKTTNEAGNLWYKLSDGNWVFSGNITPHTHKTAACHQNAALSYQPFNGREHYRISTYDALCSCGAVVQKDVLTKTAEQHTFANGTCTLCGSICVHDYTGGICSICKHEWPCRVETITQTLFTVSHDDGAKIWDRPYSKKSTHVRTERNGSNLTVVAKTTNEEGNLWYKLSDGNWVFSERITPCAAEKSCGHKYTSSSGDACILCGQFFEPTLTKIDAPMYAVKDNVPVRNAPYSGNGYVVNELENGAQVHIAYSLENSLGHPWYRTDAGNYIFADNLSPTKTHIHKASKKTKATETYTYLNDSYHLITKITAATICSCGETIEGGIVTNDTQRHRTISGGNCALCSGPAAGHAISPTLYQTKNILSVYEALAPTPGPVIRKLKPGALVTIVATQNVSDHTQDPIVLWGKTVNGTWIPLERELTGALAKKSSISLPPKGIYEVTAASAPLRELPTSSATIKEKLTPGQRVQITNTYYNDAGNQWGTTADGYEVYLGNLRYTGTEAQVIINGTILKPSSPLLNENGRLLVPVRDIADALGAHIHWDQDSQTVLIQRDLDSVILQIGNNKIYSEEIKSIDVGAKLVNNRTYVPLRALSEMFDAEVGWIDGTKTATVDCPIPSTESVNKSIIDDFKQWEFYSFNFYKTFAAEHSGSAAPLHVIGNIGEFGVKITAGVFKDVFEALIYNKYDEVHPLDDYSINQIKTSMKAIISAIPELERHVALNAAFSGQYDNVDNVKDLAKFVEEGGNFLHDEFKFKTKGMASFCKQAGRVLDLTKFSTESLEYIFTEYQHQLIYLDILEQACANSPYTAMAVDELREEYENKVLGTLKHSQDKLLEAAADELLGKIPLYDLTTILVEGVFDLSGVNENTQNTLNAASNYIITANLVRYYSTLTKDCFDLSSGNLKSTVSQAAWDRVSTAFTLTKTAVRLNYQSMHDAAHNSAIQAYLKAQLDVLNRIHIQPYVSKARNAPYYYR